MSYRNVGVFFGQTAPLKRLGALTDGVYAIVLTLLVLDLKVPETPGLTEAQLLADLWNQTPNFIAYLVSFFMVAFSWMRNFWIFKHLKQCNEKMFWLNFSHLLFVSLTPYTASLIGHYHDEPFTVILFSGSIGLASLSLFFLHRLAAATSEWHQECAPNLWRNPNWWAMYPGPLFALSSILLSFVSINGAVALWFLTPVWTLLFWRK